MRYEDVYPPHEVRRKAKQQPYLAIVKMVADAVNPKVSNTDFAKTYGISKRRGGYDISLVRKFREYMREIMNRKSAASMRREIEDLMRILE